MALDPHDPDLSSLSPKSTYKLASGYEMPVFGFGVYQTPAADTHRLTTHALRHSYTLIDSAVVYRNEPGCGLAIRSFPPSITPRSEIFYVSKVPPRKLSHSSAINAVEKTLTDTGLDYVDLYLLHSPYGGSEARLGAWEALVQMQRAGKVRSIGVSNFGVHHLEELERWIAEREDRGGEGAGGVISVNQVEVHPWLPRTDVREWCKKRGIVVQAYSPLARGQHWGNEVLSEIVKRVGRTPAQVLLRWGLQGGVVPTVKSVDDSVGGRIETNFDVWDWELSSEDMDLLSGQGEDEERYFPSGWDPTVEPLTK